jgi:hypothetical protein
MHHINIVLAGTLAFFVLLVGCTLSSESGVSLDGLTPTTHPFFTERTLVSAFPTTDPSRLTTVPTLEPTAQPTIENIEPVIPIPSTVISLTLFDDSLSPFLELETSPDMTYIEEDDTAFHIGDSSLSLTGEDGSFLSFQVLSSSQERFLRDRVLGLSFWLSSGEYELEVGQLLVEIYGSNDFSYWVEGDTSALIDLETFSGKLIYGLELNRSLAPETWVRIEILLDNLVYDPNFDEEPIEDIIYDYVTGFAIQFAQGFSGTIYLDNIQLLILAE